MKQTLQFLLQYGYGVLFLNVLAEQMGLPIPAVPILLAMGALAGLGNFSLAASLVLAVLACLISDAVWFELGRKRGVGILQLLCRISLEPEVCVSRTKGIFGRYGDKGLLVAKFLPGFSTVAPPLAGINHMSLSRFLVLDGIGSLLWSFAFLSAGFILRHQLEEAAEWIARLGSGVGAIIGAALAAYALIQMRERRRYLKRLREARITPEEVLTRLQSGETMFIVDLRASEEVDATGLMLPGALRLTLADLEERHEEIPRDREIILYCS